MINKRIISILTASTLALAGNLSYSVCAAEDLGTLASSLGADTNYLNIPYIKDTTVNPDGKKQYSDESFYITTMEVLTHNGSLKVSDLQEDALKMSDISDSDALREKIKSENEKLGNRFIYSYTFKKAPAKDKIPALLSTAEEAYANNEYFHIGYRGLAPEFEPDTTSEYETFLSGHYVTGIGITDGSWTFNGRAFDKCILTLDTINTANGESAFSEDTCIYVNSETYDYYIPKYSDSATEDIHIIAIDNDTMVNGDTSNLFNIRCTKKNSEAFYTITSKKDGIETVRNNENDFLDYYHNAYNGNFFIKADSLKIDCESIGLTETTITNDDICVVTSLSAGNSTFDFDGKSYCLSGAYNNKYGPVGGENNDFFSYDNGKMMYDFYGKVLEGFSFEPAKDSFFIDGGTGVRFVGNKKAMGNIFVSQKTEVRYDENGITDFFIDIDKDGQFEHKVEKGDVNCDGMIDASDASLVLQAYSALSTGGTTYLSNSLADWDDNGMVDASDSSFILQKYAELSTTK